MLQTLIAKKYKLSQKLAIGPFYEVFKGVHHHNQTAVAIKIQKRSVSESKLFNEVKILRDIQGEDLTTDLGFPHVLETGNEGIYNYLVMDLLGQSLDKMLVDRGGKLDPGLVFQLGLQIFQRLEVLHQKEYVHRDVRPEHFLYGRPKRPNRIYLNGLSMSRKYLRPDKKHAVYKDNKGSFTGTARYLSVTAHMGIQQSRRDDIESAIYMMIYLIKGSLPWQKLKAQDKQQKFDKILEAKIVTPLEVICRDTPIVMQQLLLYARMLEYQDNPDYQYLKSSLRNVQKAKED